MFCFFKQKTADEMRISDWSSDVCSSDLIARAIPVRRCNAGARVEAVELAQELRALFWRDARERLAVAGQSLTDIVGLARDDVRHCRLHPPIRQIGRASCRERVCQYV